MNASRLPQKASRTSAPAVKDDWDDDEDSEEEAPTEERNKQIWEDACVIDLSYPPVRPEAFFQ